jgi:hypothetical protein
MQIVNTNTLLHIVEYNKTLIEYDRIIYATISRVLLNGP